MMQESGSSRVLWPHAQECRLVPVRSTCTCFLCWYTPVLLMAGLCCIAYDAGVGFFSSSLATRTGMSISSSCRRAMKLRFFGGLGGCCGCFTGVTVGLEMFVGRGTHSLSVRGFLYVPVPESEGKSSLVKGFEFFWRI